MTERIAVETAGKGLHEITGLVAGVVADSGVQDGLCTVCIQHTSASLTIQENADPSARRDLEAWLSRLVQENDSLYTHTAEGPDDMPSHIKAALTATTLSIPVVEGRLVDNGSGDHAKDELILYWIESAPPSNLAGETCRGFAVLRAIEPATYPSDASTCRSAQRAAFHDQLRRAMPQTWSESHYTADRQPR